VERVRDLVELLHRRTAIERELCAYSESYDEAYDEANKAYREAISAALLHSLIHFLLGPPRIRIKRLRSQLLYIKRLILVLLRRLTMPTFISNLVVVERWWFFLHGTRPPRTAALSQHAFVAMWVRFA
jgi:hypothetical protein